MIDKIIFQATLLTILITIATPVAAKVSAEEAAKLGKELTPLGAEAAGNAAGTIPAWEGGITQPPAGYSVGMHHPDPFADDEPLFVITAEISSDYADNLTPGQLAIFERYPDTYSMPVYQSRRSASYPDRIYDKTLENAVTATLTEDGNGVVDATQGVPFPIPNSALEVLWNHLLRYRGDSLQRVVGQAAPTVNGEYIPVVLNEEALFPYHQADATTESYGNTLVYFLQELIAPPAAVGNIVLVHETLNQAAEPRKVWFYNTGQRRVRRAPNTGYDTPGTGADGQRTTDQLDMYNGAPDRYDWNLVGKKEIYIPYNSYRIHSDQLTNAEIIQAGHINTEHSRYELHRVWVIEGTLKSGFTHVYAKRTFYIDEDSWQIAVADQYDGGGNLWRVSEAHLMNYYEVPVQWETLTTVVDLQNGRYLVRGLDNEFDMYRFDTDLTPGDFRPERLRRKGR